MSWFHLFEFFDFGVKSAFFFSLWIGCVLCVTSREEQFEDYGEGEDVDFTPSSPCPEEETRTNGFSDLGSSLPSRSVVFSSVDFMLLIHNRLKYYRYNFLHGRNILKTFFFMFPVLDTHPRRCDSCTPVSSWISTALSAARKSTFSMISKLGCETSKPTGEPWSQMCVKILYVWVINLFFFLVGMQINNYYCFFLNIRNRLIYDLLNQNVTIIKKKHLK